MLSETNQPIKSHIFIPKTLEKQLELFSSYPLIILQAASGFGKTTSVDEFLRRRNTSNVYWYTCMGEPVSKSWHGICNAFSHIDATTAHRLDKIVLPTSDNLVDISRLLTQCVVGHDTWFIIDNYQLIQSSLPTKLGLALSNHNHSSLHIVIITQTLEQMDLPYISSKNIALISNESFFFSKEDTKNYFQSNGISISKKELDQLQLMSEGWVAVLNLQLIGYLCHGTFETEDNLNALIRSIIWNPLNSKERHFLLCASLLTQFTVSQAYILLNSNTLSTEVERLLYSGSFIHYDSSHGTYTLHSLLHAFLKQELHKLPIDTINTMHQLAGDAYKSVGNNYCAMEEYWAANKLNCLLSLPIKAVDFSFNLDEDSANILEHIFQHSNKHLLLQYPETLAIITFELFRLGRYSTFQEGCNLMENLIQHSENYHLTPKECSTLTGQLALLHSFSAFNDIERMSALHKKAWNALGGPFSNRVDWNDSWTFGQPSVLYLFWSKSGLLAQEIRCMNECLPYYLKLTGGHGTGANCAMEAEALLMKGKDQLAETYCYKALYLAEIHKQDSICFSAEMTLLQIAMLRGNINDYNRIKQNLIKRGQTGYEPTVKVMSELTLSFVETAIIHHPIVPWLMNVDAIQKKLYNVALPFGILVHLRWLISNKQFTPIPGIAQGALMDAQKHCFILPQVYFHIFIAIAYLNQAMPKEAQEACSTALDLALPDGIYLPFSQYYNELLPLLKKYCNSTDLTILANLSRRQIKGRNAIASAIIHLKLTPREHEVAVLAASGLTNRDISSRLFISAETVKSIMKNIFRKLDIHSRVQLKDLISSGKL